MTDESISNVIEFGYGFVTVHRTIEANGDQRAEFLIVPNAGAVYPAGETIPPDHPNYLKSEPGPVTPPKGATYLVFKDAAALRNVIAELVALHHAHFPEQGAALREVAPSALSKLTDEELAKLPVEDLQRFGVVPYWMISGRHG